jgi:hypothetical protein
VQHIPSTLDRTVHLSTRPERPPEGERYQLLRTLAIGGMGIVYEAYDRLLEREVALKVDADCEGPSHGQVQKLCSASSSDPGIRLRTSANPRGPHPTTTAENSVMRTSRTRISPAQAGLARSWLGRSSKGHGAPTRLYSRELSYAQASHCSVGLYKSPRELTPSPAASCPPVPRRSPQSVGPSCIATRTRRGPERRPASRLARADQQCGTRSKRSLSTPGTGRSCARKSER